MDFGTIFFLFEVKMELIDQFLSLTIQSKLTAAAAVYQQLLDYIATIANGEEKTVLEGYIAVLKPIADQMYTRLQAVEDALRAADVNIGDEWTYGLTYFGITTHYKQSADGCISVRLEGVLNDVGLVEQAAVIHEMDLFSEWIPFCSNSLTMTKLGPAELVGYLYTYIMPLGRDTVMRAYAVDCLTETNKVILCGNSVLDWPLVDNSSVFGSAAIQNLERLLANLQGLDPRQRVDAAIELVKAMKTNNDWTEGIKGLDAPWLKHGWFHDKMNIKDFKAVMEVSSESTAKVSVGSLLYSSAADRLFTWFVDDIYCYD
jgi:hypothetical protein